MTVYKFEIEHGGCGGDGNWSDCDNDRQRVELTDGYKVSLQSFGSKTKQVKRYYRTNIYIPNEDEFPDTFPMTQMIHQVKLHRKNQPIWMVHYHNEGLKISTDTAPSGACFVNKKYVPRGSGSNLKYLPTIRREKSVSRGMSHSFFIALTAELFAQ